MSGLDEIVRELHQHRIVETEGVADRCAFSSRRIDRDHLADRITGEAEHRKSDDPDDEHDADGLYCPTKNEREHLVLSLLCKTTRVVHLNERSRKHGAAGTLGVEMNYSSALVAQYSRT